MVHLAINEADANTTSCTAPGHLGRWARFAVQLAKALGARVTGLRSTTKADLVRSIGADQVSDYTHADIADGARR